MRRELWRGLFLTLLFFGSILFSPVIAQARFPTIQVQSQVTASNLLSQAQTQYQQGKFEQAVILWQQLADQYERQGDSLNEAMALSNLSLTHQQLGEWDKAKEFIDESVELLQHQQNSANAQQIFAQTLDIRGRLEWQIGQSEKSLETWKKAANLYKSLEDQDGLQKNLLNQSKALQDLGFYPKTCRIVLAAFNIDITTEQTCDLSEEILNEFLEQPDSLRKFEAMQRLGNVQQIVGQLEQSRKILEAGLDWAEAQGNAEEIATSYLNLGNTEWAIAEQEYRKKLKKATPISAQIEQQNYTEQLDKVRLNFYDQAFNVATSPLIKLQARLNSYTLLVSSEQWDKAIEFFDNLIQDPLEVLPNSRASIYAQIKYGKNALILYQNAQENRPTFKKVEQILETAHFAAQTLGYGDQKAESHALKVLGELYEITQNWSKAQDVTEQALKIAPTYNNPELAYQLSWQLGRIYKEQKKLDAAIASYTNAFTTLESLRGDLVAVSPELQFSFRESVEPVYRELVDLRLKKAEQLKAAADQQQEFQAEMIKVREVIESLQLAELNNFFRDACVEANPQIIDQVSPTAAVIYPIILEDRLEIILSLPDGDQSKLDLYTEPVIAQDINQALVKFRDLLEPPQGQSIPDTAPQELLTLSQEIYNWLIRPIEAKLDNSEIDTLVFVLDGRLRNVPMSALHDGNQYLVEKYVIALTPGLQLLNPQPITQADLVGLLAGAVNAPSFEERELDPLGQVEEELVEISIRLPNYEKRQDEDFTRENLQKAINQLPFPIVHLATHGQFGSSAEDTFILTYNDEINVKDFNVLLRKPDEKNPIELLVLSACETAEGDDRAALGLAGVAVRAGARSTLATLWTVDDISTSRLMVKFYEELAKQQVNKAEALRNAQLTLLNNELLIGEEGEETRKTSHPFYWAPFVLVGNWQ